ncbi:MAG: hypothetical protein NO515_00365 [Candidatus Methanomethylicia archaeon]|jgi:hypothetical protein|uniref:Flagellin n=1 Tax=Thermoproteota archaeon TaxID=2056631 RepID=A0A523BFL3_9CREN|nr:hypothetical protein [Candidatus Methanomethylicia archaeon]MCQ5373464.1 hypothetical protein [Candidatus Methanomethylicia archaeon]NHV60645.1 hypothetical protein [Candidatus Verstraetearchaeota archaeon]TDA39612.1 MAG: hypothetical protein DSO08_01730 [Candidatus Verstraetearchaeota archaeon]
MKRKSIRGSPLVEEGLLLGLSIITLTVVLSIIVGLLSGVKDTFDLSVFRGQEFMNQLQQAIQRILQYFRIG